MIIKGSPYVTQACLVKFSKKEKNRTRVKIQKTDELLTSDRTKLYLAIILIKSSTVQNDDSVKTTQITHFALTFTLFQYQNVWKTINNGVFL